MARRRRGPTLIQQSRRVSPAEKAIYHNVAGAGKSRVKREFFDLNASDVDALATEAQRRMTRTLQSRG